MMIAILVLLVLLALFSGVSKVILLEQEVEFFGAAGFNDTGLRIFGAIQFVAGLLLIIPRYRIASALVLALTLAISTVLILMAGKIAFGLVAIIPILMIAALIRDARENAKGTS